MTFRFAFKTSFGHLQNVLARYLACFGKTFLRHLVDVFLPARHEPQVEEDDRPLLSGKNKKVIGM